MKDPLTALMLILSYYIHTHYSALFSLIGCILKTFTLRYLDSDSFSTDLVYGDSFQCLVLQKIGLPQSNMNKNDKIKVDKSHIHASGES